MPARMEEDRTQLFVILRRGIAPISAAQPKSMSVQECSSGRHSTLPGFKSLCATPNACSVCTLSAT